MKSTPLVSTRPFLDGGGRQGMDAWITVSSLDALRIFLGDKRYAETSRGTARDPMVRQ